jgi:hypothetical protein
MTAVCGGKSYKFTMPDIARDALLKGTYDLLSELLRNKPQADGMAIGLPY